MSHPVDPAGVLDALEIGVVVQDAAARILAANDAAVRLLGRSAEELRDLDSYDPGWDVTDPDGKPIPGEEHPAPVAIATGKPVRGVLLSAWVPAREERVWLVVDAVPRFSEDGALKDVIVSFTEVADEVIRNQELEEVNELLARVAEQRSRELSDANKDLAAASSRYEAVIRAMAEGVVIHGPDGGILTANPAALLILGLTLEQLEGLHPFDPHWALTREDGTELPREEIPSEVTRRTGKACANRILSCQRGVGDRAWLSVNTDPIVLGGEQVGVVATFTDVTGERDALRRAQEANDQLRWMNEMMPGALIESRYRPDGTGRITYASPGVQSVLGVSPESLVEDIDAGWRVMHPDDAASLMALRDSAEESAVASEQEYRVADGEGGWRWVRSTTSPANEIGGERVFHSLLTDVSREKELTSSLRESQRREVMGTLAAGIAHNFNNMLAAIVPSLEEARNEVEGPLEASLDDAYHAATAASELVRRLARLARQEDAGELRPVPISEVTEEVVQICRRTFDRRIGIEFKGLESDVAVRGRRAEIQQVLLNLTLNARDALESSISPQITVSVATDGSEVSVRIRDNGEGMSDETQAHLGEPFFTTKDVGQGTGLGLATALGTVREMGGSILWDSVLGEGSTFQVSFPQVLDAEPTGDAPVERAPEVEGDLRTALVIDDEPLVRSALTRMLGRLGLQVVEADGGQRALQAITDELDVVFVDLSMPGMSGDEVAEQIHASMPDLPIVLMSGYLPGDPPASVTRVLSKPFNSRKLAAVLSEIME